VLSDTTITTQQKANFIRTLTLASLRLCLKNTMPKLVCGFTLSCYIKLIKQQFASHPYNQNAKLFYFYSICTFRKDPEHKCSKFLKARWHEPLNLTPLNSWEYFQVTVRSEIHLGTNENPAF
jgi:hypothetical protein